MGSLHVVGAVIVEAGRVFCTQRGTGALAGLWEFPGGKVEAGETPQAALIREIHEELGCSADVGQEVARTTYAYSFGEITLTTFYCAVHGVPVLAEHTDGRWMLPDELMTLDWAAADVPAVNRIREDLAGRCDERQG